MGYSFLITAREGLEAGLIVAIVLGYLARTDQRRYWPHILLGTALALVGSVAVGAALEATASELSGKAQEAFEGGAMLFAVAVLTSMIFWMKRQASTMGAHMRQRVDVAIRSGSALALALLAFTAVGREGLETVLFLFAGAPNTGSSLLYWGGAGAGLAVAAAMAWVVYAGSARLPLRSFFNFTGVMLIVLAAGLLVNGMKELHEIGATPDLGPRLWDTYSVLADNSEIGRFMATIFGYDSSPLLGQVVAYTGYLALTLTLFAAGRGRPAPPAAAPAAAATAGDAVPALEVKHG